MDESTFLEKMTGDLYKNLFCFAFFLFMISQPSTKLLELDIMAAQYAEQGKPAEVAMFESTATGSWRISFEDVSFSPKELELLENRLDGKPLYLGLEQMPRAAYFDALLLLQQRKIAVKTVLAVQPEEQ